MRVFAGILAVFTILLICLGVYFVVGAKLQVASDGIVVERAQDQPQAFAAASEAVRIGEQLGRMYDTNELSDSDGYSIIRVNLSVKSIGLLPAERIEVIIAPLQGDVLQFGASPVTVDSLGSAKLQGVMLTKTENAEMPREAYIEYYVFGHKMRSDILLIRP